MNPTKVTVIDSHTAGEPTRTVIAGAPDLGGGTVADRRAAFDRHHDRFRSAVVNEPRGSDVLVGALLVRPADETCVAGVIFFNNVGTLGMCGHGTIGVVATLASQGKIGPGDHRIETPVGVVTATLHADGSVSVENVPAYRKAAGVAVDLPGAGRVIGDVAWGGNWFFLSDCDRPVDLAHAESLTTYARGLRRAVNAAGFPEVDHVELFAPPTVAGADGKNFVLCPGDAYDRCPCGTGTSAKVACLAADGKLAPGGRWVQQGILDTLFAATYRLDADGRVVPTITGRAFVTAESTLMFDPADPFRDGIRSVSDTIGTATARTGPGIF